MAALHEVGWHLRGCGCEQRESVRFVVTATGARAELSGAEPGDSVDRLAPSGTTPSDFEVAFDLDPMESRQLRFGRMIEQVSRDEDELLLHKEEETSPAFDLSVRPHGNARLRIAIGHGDPVASSDPRELRADDASAQVAVGEPVSCRPPRPPGIRSTKRPAETCKPYVRVWHVEPSSAISESAVDPEISERLKALGYAW